MAILALVMVSASADAATITINTFNQIAPGQCTIATAIASINAAADQVGCTHTGTYGTSDTINLAAGTYASTVIDNGQNAYPVINVALIINGNGATLSRTVGGVAPFFRFFEVGGSGLTLNNATLTGGNTTGGASGGAIFVDGGTVPLSVSGSTFSNNIAAGGGGAIFEDSDLAFTITNTTFTGNNAAGGGGGAIFDNTTGGMTLTNTTFTSNSASAGGGGAVDDNSTNGLTINTATFTSNSATGGGGGAIFDNSTNGLVFNCGSVTNNSVITAGNNGGGIDDNSDGGIQITGVVFTGNSATFKGGAIFDNSTVGTGPVSNNSFVGNTATIGGGGVFRTSPTLNAVNNWWGSASGPSGAGPGTGDAVSTDVTFAPFLTSAPSICSAGPLPPTAAKNFGAATIPLNGSTSLTFTITNPNASSQVSGVTLNDTLPAGLVVSTPNGLVDGCTGVTATAGSGTIFLNDIILAANTSCTYSVNVTGTTLGLKSNTTDPITSDQGTGGTASASVTVVAAVAPPTIAIAFGAASIPLNGSTSLTFTVTNPNGATTLTGIGFTDPLPAGLVVSTPAGVTVITSCGGTITATPGTSAINFGGSATLLPGASCIFSVNVTGIGAGLENDTTSAVTSNDGSGNTASASIVVVGAGPPPPNPTNTPIPTLQQWALSVLSLLLIVAAGVTFRRRRREYSR